MGISRYGWYPYLGCSKQAQEHNFQIRSDWDTADFLKFTQISYNQILLPPLFPYLLYLTLNAPYSMNMMAAPNVGSFMLAIDLVTALLVCLQVKGTKCYWLPMPSLLRKAKQHLWPLPQNKHQNLLLPQHLLLDEPDAIAMVLPLASNYDSDSDKDTDISNCDVSVPFKPKHLVWCCQVHRLINCFPVVTHALINNGAHVIFPELVDELNLKKCHLHKPEIVDVTLHNGLKSLSKLYEYVKLSLTPLDAIWTLKSVTTLITPGLSMPIIFGLPFLIHNAIVTNHAAHTCVDEFSNYDLLNLLPVFPPPPPEPWLWKQIAEKKADKKLMLAELMMVCNNCFKNYKLQPQITENFDVIGAICRWIEILAMREALLTQDSHLKSEFKEVFKPIPHVNELLSDIITSIQLKNTEKTIKSHSYPSPHKYKEAWSIPIQQHLDAWHICPSSSPCASPAFIVPKANLNVVPCRVNNYHQINENTVVDSHPIPCTTISLLTVWKEKFGVQLTWPTVFSKLKCTLTTSA